ncbi:MAG: L-seryl-tRNA(Sec) selenium transferase, partial [Chloroflexi bacterium RBG_13_56_8]
MRKEEELRKLPSVDKLLQGPEVDGWAHTYGRNLVVEAVRETLEALRRDIEEGTPCPSAKEIIGEIQVRLESITTPTLRPVINATGVILHTNLGRAPLSEETLAAMRLAGSGYSNLEFDLEAGRRGSRYMHAEALLCWLTGAEAALLVNNNAGAVLLALTALAKGHEVVISRGQLVEIGGGFRIPEVMAQSGATLVEVGTTNRSYLRDYAAAIGENSAALMRVHASNFRVRGFTCQPTLTELVGLAREQDLLMIDDLGSGTLLDTTPYGLVHEPTIQESVAEGADVVTFSGDKLLGGPQAGIIVGKAVLISRLRRHPLTRALRVDKTTIAGIQTNLLHYLLGEAESKIPIWRMISQSRDEVDQRARQLLGALGTAGAKCELVPGRSTVGGGSLPEETLPTMLIALPGKATDELARSLRTGT